MTKRIQAKHKIDRRLGENIWGRPKSPVNKREYGPGEHGQRRQGKISDYGLQLRAKQKLKGYYGNLTEKQFKACYREAVRLKGDTGENLIGLLERRLDTIVYRAKIVPTVFAARQFINHGHVKVNGRKTNIGSARLKIGDIVEVREKSRDIPMVIQALDSAEREIPEYVEFNREKFHISIKRIPGLSDVPYPVQMEPNLVIEFYSR
jgi:small subunit ribosomal protein S4